MTPIYLDNNATTPLLPAVWEAMRPYFTDIHGNPASSHQAGRRARRALEDARELVARRLNAHPADEIVFTSGATEANNLALFGLAGEPPGHLVASPVEHPSVLEPLRFLAGRGFALDYLLVNAAGCVNPDELPNLLRPDTRLVAVQLANHETGTVQPVRELVSQSAGIPVHCDAVQAVGKVPVNVSDLGVATLSLSAHKFHGPKGVGALFVRRETTLRPLLHGGHQQRGRRPGTESVALAVGLATALDLALREMTERTAAVLALRERFLRCLRAEAEPVVLNSPAFDWVARPSKTPRVPPEATGVPSFEGLPHTLNLSFPGLRADALLIALDLAGVCCSTGSACSSGSLVPSPVLQAMNVPPDALRSAMRFSLSHLLTTDEIDDAARRVVAIVRRLRSTPNDPLVRS